ncbi:MAG: hypothetical protein Q8L77_02205 [Nitrospirota bacterium]|nr:hypothetical protein [Nitrospirota bacterium]
MAAETTDDFQKELIDLFVQEAQEWLQNIHVALDELQQGPAPERHAKLIGIISAGVTNLGGSAATINLPDVEQASFKAIPFIEAIRDPNKSLSVQDFLSLCKQLGQIHAALTQATGISFEDDGSGAAVEAACSSLSSAEFLQALQGLEERQPQAAMSGRNVIRAMIEQIEGQVQAGVGQVDATVIQGYLTRVSEAEESFLDAIGKQVPAISEKLNILVQDGDEPASRMAALDVSLQDVARLRIEAQQVNAGAAMLFFAGLHSLLTVVAQRRVCLAAARVDRVKARLHVMGTAICEWAEHGRAQRAAINQLLPSSQS